MGKNSIVCVLYVVHSETVRTFYLGSFSPVKYITKCLIVYGCVAKGSYFSVHHKFSNFLNKVCEKGGKVFFLSQCVLYVVHSETVCIFYLSEFFSC